MNIVSAARLPEDQLFWQLATSELPPAGQQAVNTLLDQVKDVSLAYGPFGHTSYDSLFNRVVLLSTVTLSVATYALWHHYSVQPISESWVGFIGRIFSIATISFFPMVSLSFALGCLIQFKNAYAVIPGLSDPNFIPSRVFLRVYSIFKYVLMAAIAMSVFRACSKNFYNGVLCVGLMLPFWEYPKEMIKTKLLSEHTLEKKEKYLGQTIGWDPSFRLIVHSLLVGFASALLVKFGSVGLSAVKEGNLYDFLRGSAGGSFGFWLLLKYPITFDFHSVGSDQTLPLIKRYCYAVDKAKQQSRLFALPLSETHIKRTFKFVSAYLAKEFDPQQNFKILQKLKKLSQEDAFLHFLELQPFLTPLEVEEFIAARGYETSNLYGHLKPAQLQEAVFGLKDASLLSQESLTQFSQQIEKRKLEIQTALKDKTAKETLIEHYEWLVKYGNIFSNISHVLTQVNPSQIEDVGTRAYIETLKRLLPQIQLLQKSVADLEEQIERENADHTTTVDVALGTKGLTVPDCESILLALGQPSEFPYRDLLKKLQEKGIKNKHDLIKKGLFQNLDSREILKSRLIAFLSPSQPTNRKFRKAAAIIYLCIAIPFFVFIQWKFHLLASLAGLVVSFLIPKNLSTWLFRILQFSEIQIVSNLIKNGADIAQDLSKNLFVQALITIACTTRLGIIPAFLMGTQLFNRVAIIRASFQT